MGNEVFSACIATQVSALQAARSIFRCMCRSQALPQSITHLSPFVQLEFNLMLAQTSRARAVRVRPTTNLLIMVVSVLHSVSQSVRRVFVAQQGAAGHSGAHFPPSPPPLSYALACLES